MVRIGWFHVALVGVTALFMIAIAILAYQLPSWPSVVEEAGTPVEGIHLHRQVSFLQKARHVLLQLGLIEEPMCDLMPGMITVEVEPPGTFPNLGLMYLNQRGTLVLMDARTYKNWSCFTFGTAILPVGSHFVLEVADHHKVNVHVADMAWLSMEYSRQDLVPPCSEGDTDCTETWMSVWGAFREGGDLAKMQHLLPMVLFGPDYPFLSSAAKTSRVVELRKHHYDRHLHRMWEVSNAAGKSHWIANVLNEAIALSDADLDRFMRSRVITSICDMLEMRLLQEDHVSIFLNIHAELVPRCNTHSIHDHAIAFASTLVFGTFVHNVYVGNHRPLGSLHGEALANDAFVLEAARYERDYMRYLAAGGCDVALQRDDNSSNSFHVATFAGEQLPYAARKETGRDWGIMQLAECSTINAGSTYLMPFNWVHRPRRPPGCRSAMTVAVFDKVADEGFGETKLHSNTYNFSLAAGPQEFRTVLSQIADFLKGEPLSGSPEISFDMRDGGIARYVDDRLGQTDDDTWY